MSKRRCVAFWGTHRIDTSDFMLCGKAFAGKSLIIKATKEQLHSANLHSGRDRCDASFQSRILKIHCVQRKRNTVFVLQPLYFSYPAIKLQKRKYFFLFFSFWIFFKYCCRICLHPFFQTFYVTRAMPKHLQKRSLIFSFSTTNVWGGI